MDEISENPDLDVAVTEDDPDVAALKTRVEFLEALLKAKFPSDFPPASDEA